jgi:hypothetical protein
MADKDDVLALDLVVQQHQPLGVRRCFCGWGGDEFGIHFLDMLRVAGFHPTRDGHAVIDGQPRKLVERVLHTNIREVCNAEDMWTEWDDVTAYVLESEVSR